MRKQATRRNGLPRNIRARNTSGLQPISDQEVYNAYAVEHAEGVGPVQAFRNGDPVSLLTVDFRSGPAIWDNSWTELAERVNILEVRKTAADLALDFRWVKLNPTDAYDSNFVPNSPAFYSTERNVVPKTLEEIDPESRERVELSYRRNVQLYTPYWADTEFRDSRGIPDPNGMLPEADQAWGDLARAGNDYRTAMDAAVDARDAEAAETAFYVVFDSLWTP